MMSQNYSLTVINRSEQKNPTFAIFATLPTQQGPGAASLAWALQQIDKGNHYTFTWAMDWAFVWAAQGANPGYQWNGGGDQLPADPTSNQKCTALFTNDGDFNLNYASGTADGQDLTINDDASVPLPDKKASSVGVTLNGSPIVAVDAGPRLTQTFNLHPTYYINSGTYVEGQMVSVSDATSYQELVYAGGNTALTAILNTDNTWSVQPSSEINFAKLLGTPLARAAR